MTTRTRSRKLSPDRSLQWRWERANEIVRSDAKPSRRDDELVRLAVKYLRRRQESRGPIEESALPERLWYVHFASRFETASTPPAPRAQMMILGRASATEIALPMGTVAEVVDLYQGLFFDVAMPRDRSWMMRHAVGWEHARPGDRETVLRTIAYVGGHALATYVRLYFAVEARDWYRVGSRLTRNRDLERMVQELATASMAGTSAVEIEYAVVLLARKASAIGVHEQRGDATLDLLERNAPQLGSPPASGTTPEPLVVPSDRLGQRVADVG